MRRNDGVGRVVERHLLDDELFLLPFAVVLESDSLLLELLHEVGAVGEMRFDFVLDDFIDDGFREDEPLFFQVLKIVENDLLIDEAVEDVLLVRGDLVVVHVRLAPEPFEQDRMDLFVGDDRAAHHGHEAIHDLRVERLARGKQQRRQQHGKEKSHATARTIRKPDEGVKRHGWSAKSRGAGRKLRI